MTSPKPEPLPLTEHELVEFQLWNSNKGPYPSWLDGTEEYGRLLATIAHHKARADEAERQLELRQAAHFTMINELAEQWGAKVLAAEARADALAAQVVELRAKLDHPLLDPMNDPDAANDPSVVMELGALPVERIIERLRGTYDLYPGVATPRRFYTGAISHEAANRIEALAAQVAVLVRNQRTPGTVEVCERWGSAHCSGHPQSDFDVSLCRH